MCICASVFVVTKVNCAPLYPTILFELIINRCVYVSNFVEMYIMLNTIKIGSKCSCYLFNY